MTQFRTPIAAAAFLGAALLSCAAHAQVTVKKDGQWRWLLGAGASVASGNSDATSLNVDVDGVRATQIDKWTVNGRVLYAKNDGETTSDQLGVGARYDRNIGERLFGYGQGGFLRDRPANISQRWSANTGLGYHVIASDPVNWDVYGGVGYTRDSYVTATVVADEMRSDYGYAEILLGEESNHVISETTKFKQRFVVYPNISNTGEFRTVFDAGLAVSINKTFSLTLTFGHRYSSDPGAGFDKTDTILVAGLAVKLD